MVAVSELKIYNVNYKGAEGDKEMNRAAEWGTKVMWETYSNKKGSWNYERESLPKAIK